MTGPLVWLALLAILWWWAEHGKGVTPKNGQSRHKRSDSGYAPGGRTQLLRSGTAARTYPCAMPAADPRLTTPEWRRLRLWILDRDRWQCQMCGGIATCVDHVIARADGGDMWNPNNLRAACRRCNNAGGAEVTNRRRYRTTVAVYSTRM